MKVIIAGSRDITDISVVAPILTEAFVQLNIVKPPEIVSGGAKGVDHIGEIFAKHIGYDLKVFPADWNKHGKAAGPIRNKQMAEYADAAIVIHNGSRGSLNMIEQMKKLNKPVYVKEV
mgnify:CR=1 FL=1